MARIVIRKLVARDESARVDVVIEPGVLIDTCRICRNSEPISEDEVYVMEFESEGRRMRCALVHFQARTQISSAAGVDERSAAPAIAAA